MSKYAHWVFTLNNYTEEEEEKLKNYYDTYCRYMVYGYEIGENRKIPHLQGYIQLKNRSRLTTIKKKMNIDRIHLEPQCAADNSQARTYCMKDGNYKEYGEFIQNGSNKGIKNEYYDQIVNCTTFDEVLQFIPPRYISYAREVWRNKPIKKDLSNPPKLRQWQQDVLELLLKPDDRTIYIMCDPIGNHGKTFLCNYLEDYHNAFVCGLMKSSDILYQYNNEPIICIDMPRNNDESFMISGAIETLKNGRGLVGKYEGKRIYRPYPASVIIFTNSNTGYEYATKFSKDRICLLYFNDLPDDTDVFLDTNIIRRHNKVPNYDDYKKMILVDEINN